MTCFTKSSLLKIARAWNRENPNNKVKISDASINVLWKRISKKLKEKCNHEWCWAQQQFIKDIKDKEINSTFKPRKPKKWNTNKTEWLSTIDIENVVKQYEKKYQNFRFIGAVPIDFDSTYGFGQCIVNELCKINLEKLILNKIFQVGIIFNLDKHNQDGSHWVGMFIDLKRDGIYYFDSYGEPEPKEVKELANRLSARGSESDEEIEFRMSQAVKEIKHFDQYDYVLINDDVENVFSKIRLIIEVERMKLMRQKSIKNFVTELSNN